MFYNRNDVDFTPGTFRVRGDVVEVFPAYLEDEAYRIVFWGDEVEKIARINPVTGDELALRVGHADDLPGQALRDAQGPGRPRHRRASRRSCGGGSRSCATRAT